METHIYIIIYLQCTKDLQVFRSLFFTRAVSEDHAISVYNTYHPEFPIRHIWKLDDKEIQDIRLH